MKILPRQKQQRRRDIGKIFRAWKRGGEDTTEKRRSVEEISAITVHQQFSQKCENRLQVCDDNNHRDSQNWSGARDAVAAVGLRGMSGDETDACTGRIKDTVRIRVPWLNQALAATFHTIDTYSKAIDYESFRTPASMNKYQKQISPRGNPGLRCSTRDASDREGLPTHKLAVYGLPRNWYDDAWYNGLSQPQRRIVNAAPVRPLPILVSFNTAMVYIG